MPSDTATAISALGDLPIAPLITSLAKGIAEAQLALDQVSIQVAQMMAGTEDANRVVFGSRSYSLLELGFSPTFYHFTESVIEVKVSISMTVKSESKGKLAARGRAAGRSRIPGAGTSVSHVASVDASYANKYSYSVEGASRVQTRLTPVPAPEIFYERVRTLMEAENAYREQVKQS